MWAFHNDSPVFQNGDFRFVKATVKLYLQQNIELHFLDSRSYCSNKMEH